MKLKIAKLLTTRTLKKQGIMKAIVNQTVADERIQRLNEIKSVKMSSISSKKRPAAKAAKEVAIFILNNWEDGYELAAVDYSGVSESDFEIFNKIILSRLNDIEEASKASEEAVKVVNYKNVKEIIDSFKLTDNETEVILLLNDQLKSYFGETYSDVDCNDIADLLKMNVKTVKGVIGSLVKKNICGTYDTGTGYDVVIFSNQENMSFYHMKVNDSKPAKAEKASTKKEAKNADKEEQPKEKEAKTARKVGDVHPKHPTWIWTEYTKGKFDWRTNTANKKQGQRTDLKK